LKNFFLLLLIATLFLSGCGADKEKETENPFILEGHIIEKKDNRILVVEGITANDLQAKTAQEILEQANPNAYWLTLEEREMFKVLSIGDSVEAWLYGEVETSYPAQAHATKIEKTTEK